MFNVYEKGDETSRNSNSFLVNPLDILGWIFFCLRPSNHVSVQMYFSLFFLQCCSTISPGSILGLSVSFIMASIQTVFFL